MAEEEDAGFARAANAACRAILDARPPGVLSEGMRAGVDVLMLSLGRLDPDAVDRAGLGSALDGRIEELRRDLDRLGDLSPPGALADDWRVFLGEIERKVDLSENRRAWLADEAADLLPADGGRSPDGLMESLERLTFMGRDCELMLAEVDVPEEARAFVAEAAAICTRMVDRRAAAGYGDHSRAALMTLADAHQGRLDLPRPEAEAALAALAAEWRQSHADLAGIDPGLVPDAEGWSRFLGSVDDIAELHEARLAILLSSPEEAPAAYLAVPRPAPADMAADAPFLEVTDCRGLTF